MRRLAAVGLACLALAAAAPRPASAEEPATESFTLENGLRVVVRKLEGAIGAFVHLRVAYGEAHDPAGKSGLAQVLARLWTTCAAGTMPARTQADADAAYDGHLRTEIGDDFISVCSGVPADRLRAEIGDVAARMANLRIGPGDFASARDSVLGSLWHRRRDYGLARIRGMRLAGERLRPLPHGRRGGVEEEVAALRLEDARDTWWRFFKPANATLVVAGNVDPALVRAGVRRRFGGIPAGERPPEGVAPPAKTATETLMVGGLLPVRMGVDWPLACLVLDAPPTMSARERAAVLILLRRLEDQRPSAPTPPRPPKRAGDILEALLDLKRFQQWMLRESHVDYFHREERATLLITESESDTPRDASAVERLRKRLRDAASAAVGDEERTASSHPEWWDWTQAGAYPCEVARVLARRERPAEWAAVRAALREVTVEDLAAVAARPTAGVVLLRDAP